MALITSRLSKTILVLKTLRAKPGQTITELTDNTKLDDSTLKLIIDDLYFANWIRKDKIGTKTFHSATDDVAFVVWYLEKADEVTKARKERIDNG